jgi:acetyl-CoA C-acetyltransferase
MVNRVVSGEVKVAVLAGSECLYGRRRARKEGVKPDWTPFTSKIDYFKGQRPISNAVEARHGIVAPIQLYPLFENALRHKLGHGVDEHQAFLGRFMARNAAVAAENPNAWFPTAHTAEEIATPTADNRMVCFPYPKRMNAIMEVDLAAAIIVMGSDEATRRGIPADRQVSVLGGASASDSWAGTERADFVSSPGIRAASEKAFEHAAITVDDIDLFDFYSCFPSAVQLAINELGVATDDPRGVTVTGGLAYAGGPGNSYAMHGLAVMTERLRDPGDPATTGLVTALGMTMTKHAYVVLSTDGDKIAKADGMSTKLGVYEGASTPTLVDERSGDVTVETYTAEYDREGNVSRTMFVVRFDDDGSRTVANGMCTDDEICALTTTELVGRRGSVTGGRAGAGEANVPNRFQLDLSATSAS